MRGMSSKLTDVCRDLQLTEIDMRVIREREEQSRLWTIVAGAVVVVGSFVAGYLIAGYTSSESYPFSAATAGPMMAIRSRKRRWQLGIVLAFLAFLSFSLGAALRDPPNYGVGTYYEAYSRET
jgi:hypothetical protein